ncbi:MAG: hypothetical protein ACPGVU_13170 [Limisphaerales bacterium]
MRGTTIAFSIFLFIFVSMAGSWFVQATGPGDNSDQWRLLPFRNAFGLGVRSFLFSFPFTLLCLIFQHQLWPVPLRFEITLRNLTALLLFGIILGRVNLATF